MSLPTDVSHATQRVMRSTGKHPKIQQRWASTEYDDEPSSSGYASAPPQPASVRRANISNNSYEDNSDDDERRPLARARPPAAAPDDDEPPLFSSRRLALECAILLFILSWLAALGVLFASRYEECRGAQASHYGRFVNIASASGALSWTVGKDGVLGHDGVANELLPRPVEALRGKRVVEVAAADSHSAVRTESGEVICLGGA